MLRVVFMGSDEFSLPVLQALISRGPHLAEPVSVAGVVTAPDRPAGRGRRVAQGPVKALAVACGLPVLQPQRVRNEDALQSLLALRPDLIVVASYGQILPRALLDAPEYGCLNLHPSLLPLFRGPSPIAGAILAGETVTGITLMLMSPRMDAGDVLAQEEMAVGEEETAGELTGRLADASAGLLLRRLPDWLSGRVTPVPQDEARATYTQMTRKEDGAIDWNEPAVAIARRVRAYNPWPTAYTTWETRGVQLLRAHARDGEAAPGLVTGVERGALTIGTGRGLLGATEVQLAGSRPLAAETVLRGHPRLVGAVLGGGA